MLAADGYLHRTYPLLKAVSPHHVLIEVYKHIIVTSSDVFNPLFLHIGADESIDIYEEVFVI